MKSGPGCSADSSKENASWPSIPRAETGPSTRSSPHARPGPFRSDIPDEQVATFLVNPATVLAIVRHVLAVPKGEWLLQSAAGSNLGRMIINLGKHDGFKTLNVVRRREAIDELKKLGGDAVISSADGPIDEQVQPHHRRQGRAIRHRPRRRTDRDRSLPVARQKTDDSSSMEHSPVNRWPSIRAS